VASSEADPVAPFALRPEKQYVFSPDGAAAVAYRVRLRTAVACGDPLGAHDSWPAAVASFMALARKRKLRVAVIATGERARPLWAAYGLWGVPIGRDVVVRRGEFDPNGRRFRNLRQAVQRSHNSGVSVCFVREGEADAATVTAIRALMRATKQNDTRGFSMIRGRLFDGTAPDAVFAVARHRQGHVVAAHRYLWAGSKDLSLDVPVRSFDAPNGVDERLVAETIAWGAERGVERVSLAFAPFPELFEDPRQFGRVGVLLSWITHLLDPLIRVERLYRYLRKYHAFDQERYVMLRKRQVVIVAVTLLLLEFSS
jgi:lysylphosphatidylglycerol synthetase-like protein (DUF2156 family)